MSTFLSEALSAVSDVEWDEIPVGLEEFVTGEHFLNIKPLSKNQYDLVANATQIYKKETLYALYGAKEGERRWRETNNEVIMMLGKGSGKDHCSNIACAYVVYLLLCLKDPAGYYGYEENEPIDLVNIAINADQAKNVFFKRFVERIKKSPWFYGKWSAGTNSIAFDKNVTLYSGHSEREAFEGLNLMFAVLDEISGFALESNTGNQQANTAHATYMTYKESITSRYPDFGKIVLLSWPRFPGDYIQQRYGGYDDPDKGIIGAVADNGKAKEVILRSHTFKINDDLPDGIDGNEFSIEWEEDHILRYSRNRVYAMRRPSWEMNPLRKIEDYKDSFLTNKADALMRFACLPTGVGDFTFIKNKQAIYDTFITHNPVDNDGVFSANFLPKMDSEYYIHVDLSKVHDRCAVALAHVDKWIVNEFDRFGDSYPVVRVDAIRWWKPSKDRPMDYAEVVGYILALKRRGFNIKLVTFDRWNSIDTMNTLISKGIETDRLSVDTPHYDDFLATMYDDRLIGPNIPELTEELDELMKFEKGTKVVIDHPRKGYKDLSDAMTGAIYNAITHTLRPNNREVEVSSLRGLRKKERLAERERTSGIIEPPRVKQEMPDEFRDNFDKIITDAIRIL